MGKSERTGSIVSYASYPELTVMAIKQKMWKSGLRYWYYLRETGHETGSSFPKMAAALSDGLGLTLRYAYKVLARGEGRFWTRLPDGTARMSAARQLASGFGVQRLWGPVERPVEDLASSATLSVYDQVLEWVMSTSNHNPTRKTITKATGIPRRTQQWHEARRDIRRKPTYTLVEKTGDSRREAGAAYSAGVLSGKYHPHTHMHRWGGVQATLEHGSRQITLSGVFRRGGNEYPSFPIHRRSNARTTAVARARNGSLLWVPNELLDALNLCCL